jgi:hypothetical protein
MSDAVSANGRLKTLHILNASDLISVTLFNNAQTAANGNAEENRNT